MDGGSLAHPGKHRGGELNPNHDEDADGNDHVMMDDAFGCEDQNDDQTDAPQVDEECDVDMEEMLRHIELEVLLGSAKGLENFETLKKAAKDRMYEGCGKE